MPTKRTVKKAATKKAPPAPKLPPVKFSEIYLRGSAFKDNTRQLIANFMDSKSELQATTAVMRMIHEYYNQGNEIQSLIKERNELQEKLQSTRTNLRILHAQITKVVSVESKLNDQRSKLSALHIELIKEVPKIDDDWDDD